MANTYVESSSWINIPKSKMPLAVRICKRVARKLEKSEDGYCGVIWEPNQDGIWFHEEESMNPDHIEAIARALVEELKLPPFFCSWAYTCSKSRIDEFGGGAFAIVRGKETIWCDAMSQVQQQVGKGI